MFSFVDPEINPSTIIAGVAIGIGVVAAKIIEVVGNSRRKDEKQIFEQQRKMNSDLLQRIQQLESSLKEARTEITELRYKNAQCLEEHRKSQDMIETLQTEVKRLQTFRHF